MSDQEDKTLHYYTSPSQISKVEIKPSPQKLVIQGTLGLLMEIDMDNGTITVGENANTTEAAEEFLDIIRKVMRQVTG